MKQSLITTRLWNQKCQQDNRIFTALRLQSSVHYTVYNQLHNVDKSKLDQLADTVMGFIYKDMIKEGWKRSSCRSNVC